MRARAVRWEGGRNGRVDMACEARSRAMERSVM